MPSVYNLSWLDVFGLSGIVYEQMKLHMSSKHSVIVYPVPRGGIPAALSLDQNRALAPRIIITDDPHEAHCFVDDIVDSGKTRKAYQDMYDKPFYALVDKTAASCKFRNLWVSFPWERMSNDVAGIEDNIVRILQHIGEDPKRDGLKETPHRVAKSYDELYQGYNLDPESVFKTFEDKCDQMVLLKNIEFFSTCEHHMIPFYGKAHIAYIPNGKVIGISKLARLLEIYSRRLQIQERIGQEITKALDDHLQPLGSACIIEAKHLCMCARGVGKQHSEMITSSLTGVFRENGNSSRTELMQLVKD